MTKDRIPVEIDDAIILLLGAPSKAPALRDRIAGVTRLEKLVFLLEKETDFGQLLTENGDFEAYNFGPFSSKIYQAVETLTAAGLLEDSSELSSSTEDTWETEQLVGTFQADPYATRNFSLTTRGRRYYKSLLQELPKSTETGLADFKAQFASVPLRQLIRYIYKRYPEFTKKSLIRNQSGMDCLPLDTEAD